MGLIITELRERKPELSYFDESYEGDYPKEAPFTISELEEIYPAASARSKEDEAYREKALTATHELQQGRRGYMALWNHIMNVSVSDLKANYKSWMWSSTSGKRESDAQPYIPDMIQKMKDEGFAYEDQGALIVDVKEETDTKEVPPCMLLKSDGASPVHHHGSGYYRGANEAVPSGRDPVRGGQAPGDAFYSGVPLRPQDGPGKRGYKAFLPGLRHHERKDGKPFKTRTAA